jgi:alpha-methylacyl-CoA racemase
VPQPAPAPRFSGHPDPDPEPGEHPGADPVGVLRRWGLPDDRVAALRRDGVVV